ncbi:MAG: BTAD domain-containing putative transcriptional regulator [Smithella sp.]
MIKTSRPIPKSVYYRPLLFEKLDRLRHNNSSIWISAPAGSGKTTLVASYIEKYELPCLWYQLDASDGDMATFFYYMGQAAAKAAPRKRKPMPLLTPEYLYGIPTFTLSYFEELYRRLKVPFLLVFDNYQEVPENSPFHEIMHIALSHLPEGVNAIVISRREPPSAFIRLQANQQMDFLRWEDVRLTEEEAREIVALRHEKLASSDTMHHLYRLCNGWAVGLVLLSIAAKREKITPKIMAEHAPEEIFTYFMHEIFANIDPKTRQFLLTTAFFPKMTARMAEKLTGNSSAGEILRRMVRNNYFISRQFYSHPVYEYHPLFRNFILSCGRETMTSDAVAVIQHHAGVILEKEGQIEDAVSLLRDAADYEGIARIIMTHAPAMFKQGRYTTLRQWLESLPHAFVDDNPWLLYWKGMSIFPYSPAKSRSYLEKAFQLFEKQKDDTGVFAAWAGVVRAFNTEFNDFKPVDKWITWFDERFGQNISFPSSEIEASVTMEMMGVLLWRMPAHPDIPMWANRTFSLLYMDVETDMRVSVNVAHYYVFMGKFDRCGVLIDEMRKVQHHTSSPHRQISFKIAEAHWYNASMEFEGKAIQAISEGLSIASKTGVYVLNPLLYVQGIAAAFNQKDMEKAGEFLSIMKEIVREESRALSSVYFYLSAWHSVLRGDISRGVILGEKSLKFCEEAGIPVWELIVRLGLAHFHHETGEYQKAQSHLDIAREMASAMGSDYFSYLVHLTDAYFKLAQQNSSQALEALQMAMTLGRQNNFTTMLNCWRPAFFSRLCAYAIAEGIEVEYAKHLIRKLKLLPDASAMEIENWPWPVEIYTLDRFVIVKDGDQAAVSGKTQKKPLMMLKAIIALGGEEGAEVRKERIIDALWPDAEGDAGETAFHTTISRLRQLVGDEVIELHGGKVSLNKRYCWVDIWAFEQLCGRMNPADNSVQAFSAIRVIADKALDLYKGTFLPADADYFFTISSRERLRSKYYQLITHMGNMLEKAGNWQAAADYYSKGLIADPIVEEFYQGLMNCYIRLDRKAEAMITFQQCRKVLHAELGMEPSEKTKALGRELLSLRKVTAL